MSLVTSFSLASAFLAQYSGEKLLSKHMANFLNTKAVFKENSFYNSF